MFTKLNRPVLTASSEQLNLIEVPKIMMMTNKNHRRVNRRTSQALQEKTQAKVHKVTSRLGRRVNNQLRNSSLGLISDRIEVMAKS